ncbi:methyltransferase domain-containing protein [Magnetospirillum sulfuroxidans]|uniref:Methyltransferase domain-containing protein n=1 Tax=Magnetospirillum sulfuroxidans TaxID=611300 RepID=A0ABS5IGP4_9PROT|nr:methyltransferase domain-containing protein [Magnetospirillum sulfuroxidans]MBR9973601.1 methyltransferase domain-containing protein [Magnetospirillum sulfuroxidans]
MNDLVSIFDRSLLRKRRDRAAAGFAAHDFLVREAAERLADRLSDVIRSFPLALDLGCHTGELADTLDGRGGIKTLVQCDLSPRMAAKAAANGQPTLAADEEWLPFADNSFDLVLSCLSLHWVNDLPGALVQIRRVLKPDGLFLGLMLGGETLADLRHCLNEAELAEEGGISPRISPMTDVRDMGRLLQRAGFSLPVADADHISVSYGDAMRLLADLRGMGETNAVAEQRKTLTRRSTLLRALALYQDKFATADGRIPVDFHLVAVTGWKPHHSQPQPLPPGTGHVPLADILSGGCAGGVLAPAKD